jgi:hypothetical protein
MKKLFSKLNIGKKVISCPNCKQQVRIPVKKGKKLRISCPKCHRQFELKFVNPLTETFHWNRKTSFLSNLKSIYNRFKTLPIRAKLPLILLFISIIFLLFSITKKFNKPTNNLNKNTIINQTEIK